MSNGLRFDIYERVHLPENVAAIDELEEIELVPRIQVIDQGENAVLQGQLVLNGIYRAQGAGDEQVALEHWIPVEITLPMNRVTKLDEITVDIDTFDVVLLSSRALNLTGILSLRGITLEQEEESGGWNMESFTASHSRSEDGYYREDEASYEAAQQYEAAEQYEAVQQYADAQQQEAAEQYGGDRPYEAADQYVYEQQEDVQQYADAQQFEAAQQYVSAEQYEAAQQLAYEQQFRADAQAEAEDTSQAEYEQQYSEAYAQGYPLHFHAQAGEAEQYAEQEEVEYRPEELNQHNWQQASADQLASYVQFIEQKYAAAPESMTSASNTEQLYYARAEERQEGEQEQAIEQVAADEQQEIAYDSEQASLEQQTASSIREEASTEEETPVEAETPVEEEASTEAERQAEAKAEQAKADEEQTNEQENAEQWSAWEPAVAEESTREDEASEPSENELSAEEQSEHVESAASAISEPPAERELHIALNGNKEENETQGIRTILNSSLREQAAQQAATLQKQEADRQQEEAAKQQATEDEVEWQQLFIGKRPEQNEFKRIRMIIVQKDDTLEQIATRYNISARDLLIRNNLHESAITAGQLLYIPS